MLNNQFEVLDYKYHPNYYFSLYNYYFNQIITVKHFT